jgi:hypothetical protein
MRISENQLSAMLQDAAELGAKSALSQAGLMCATISKAEAIRMCGGKALLNRWLLEGVITPSKDGPKSARIIINRIQFESALKTSNRPSYRSLNDED